MVSGRAVSREAGTLIREDGDSPGFIRGEDVKENMAATQERSKQFAQSFFTEGMGVLKANQAVAQNIVGAQERNMKFFQGFFAEGMEALKNQAERARSLM